MKYAKKDILLTGMAIFSMYFGAGNFALPLLIGKSTSINSFYGSIGFFITAIILPTLSLITILSFNGNYREFLSSIGKWPSKILTIILMAVIGPFGALPRCISLSYETLNYHISGINITQFSLIICIIIFVLSIKKNNIINILGKYLTPLLLISLLLIIIIGLFKSPQIIEYKMNKTKSFLNGLYLGPQTMDLFASFFFASIIIPSFNRISYKKNNTSRSFFYPSIKPCIIGMGLLAIIYISLINISAKFNYFRSEIEAGQELSDLAYAILGKYGGIISGVTVALACLTTAIALSVIFSNFIRKEIFKNNIPYSITLFITMIITFIFTKLGFQGILNLLNPWLIALYPATFILVICSLAKKIFGFKLIKIPFYTTLIISILWIYIK